MLGFHINKGGKVKAHQINLSSEQGMPILFQKSFANLSFLLHNSFYLVRS